MDYNYYEMAEIFVKLGWNPEELNFIKGKNGEKSQRAQKIKRIMKKILKEKEAKG